MLTEKNRRKKWFDQNLKDKDIKVGDLVLMCGVRSQKKKLKYTGKGPFRVCEITPQGTIRVETLDGVETVGFLNAQDEYLPIHIRRHSNGIVFLPLVIPTQTTAQPVHSHQAFLTLRLVSLES